MQRNSYEGLIPAHLTGLIASRARALNFRPDEIDDLQQQIAPVLAKFRFDPTQPNGGTESTALITVIDRQLTTRLRAKVRYRQCLEKVRAQRATTADSTITRGAPVALQVDVRDAIASLSPRERAVCMALSDGYSVSEMAAALRCGRDTIKRRIERIRVRFTALGLRAWVGNEQK